MLPPPKTESSLNDPKSLLRRSKYMLLRRNRARMDHIQESKTLSERMSASERVSWMFLMSEYNPYKKDTRVIMHLSNTPYYLNTIGKILGSERHQTSESNIHIEILIKHIFSSEEVGFPLVLGSWSCELNVMEWRNNAIWLVKARVVHQNITQCVRRWVIWLADE